MRTTLMVLSGALVVGAVALSGQAQRQPSTLDDVVNELRALRADLRQTTRSSTQMQLLTARLTLQEQRLAVLSNQRQAIVSKLAEETRGRGEAEAQLKRFESLDSKSPEGQLPREQLQPMLDQFKRVVATHREAEQQLRAQETQLSTEISNEQNRWFDFNNRLDELERSLR